MCDGICDRRVCCGFGEMGKGKGRNVRGRNKRGSNRGMMNNVVAGFCGAGFLKDGMVFEIGSSGVRGEEGDEKGFNKRNSVMACRCVATAVC